MPSILCIVLHMLLGFSSVHSNAVVKPIPAPASKACPQDYRIRVETCIMDAQVAPQAGGGLNLIIRNDTILDLCERGLLRKTIDCLEEIYSRCSGNATILQELDRLYSVDNWVEGEKMLCEDTELFLDNYDCISQGGPSVMTCVLMCTQMFRMGLYLANPDDHATVKEVTCNFAESMVKCVRGSLVDNCPKEVVKMVGGAMHRFLPPFCLAENYITVTQHPQPAVTDEFNNTDSTPKP